MTDVDPQDDPAIRKAIFAAANALWSKEHPEEAARLARIEAALDRYWHSPCGMRWLQDHDLEWAVTSGPRQTGKSCHCACHAVIQPGLVPCPQCATYPDHSSPYCRAMIGAQMDNWDVVFTVMVAILVATGAMLLHLAVSHRHKDG